MVSCVHKNPTLSYEDFVTRLEDGALSHMLDYDPLDIIKRSIDARDLEVEANVCLSLSCELFI